MCFVFFPCRSLSSKKEKKNPCKDEPNECNKCTNVSLLAIKQEGNKDRSSDPWTVPCPAVSVATAGHSAGENAVQNQPGLGSLKSTLQSFKKKNSSVSILASS